MFQCGNKKDDLSRYSNESEEVDEGEIPVEELFKKPKKGKKGRRGQWTEHLANDLNDIMLDDDKYRENLLLTNVRNIKNRQCYHKAVDDVKERCSEEVNSPSTLNKYPRSLNIA